MLYIEHDFPIEDLNRIAQKEDSALPTETGVSPQFIVQGDIEDGRVA
jgi:hypothetical protein